MNWTRQAKKARAILRNEGFASLCKRTAAYCRRDGLAGDQAHEGDYHTWILANEPDEATLSILRRQSFGEGVRISYICPAFSPPQNFFSAMVESLRSQTVSNWELCIADGGSAERDVQFLQDWAKKEPRIKLACLEENRGIALNTAAAVQLSSAPLIAFVDQDDMLASFASYEILRAQMDTGADFLYSDEDKLDEQGRFSPHFKPSWSPDTLRSYNYITHIMVMTRDLYESVGGFRAGFDGSQDHDLALRATAQAKKIVHIPKVLYHWRAHGNSVAGDGQCKRYAFEAGRAAVSSLIEVDGGQAVHGLFDASYRARYPYPEKAIISAIIPNRDQALLLRQCIESLFAFSGGANLEVLVIENDSQETQTFAYYDELDRSQKARILRSDRAFNFGTVNNLGAKEAKGELLLFLNNDVRAIEPGFLQAMAEHAFRPSVGVVGAKLLFPDQTVQHAGVVVGLGGWADHLCAGAPESGAGIPGGPHFINTIRNVSAVTGACQMVMKHKFEALGGYDERFVLCGSDVELCLRFLRSGFVNIYTPFARLIHNESATREHTSIPESDFIYSREAYAWYWEHGDPYYSRNFDYHSKIPRVARNGPRQEDGGIPLFAVERAAPKRV